MNPIRRMLHALTRTPSPGPDLSSLREDMEVQRSRHAEAVTDTHRTTARANRLIAAYRRTDAVIIRRRRA